MPTNHFEIYPVMLTPFLESNEVDVNALRELTEYYIATGSTGLFTNCLTGEMFQLTDDERILVTKTVVDQVAGRQNVVASGTFGLDQNRNIEFIKRIYDTGIYGVILNTNQLATPTESEEVVKKNLTKILDDTGDIPLGVYECPVPYKRLLSPELLGWMGETKRFVFLKDTCCNLDQIISKLDAVKGTPLQIFNANISTGLGSIEAGAAGLGSTSSNFYPELLSYLSVNLHGDAQKLNKVNTLITIFDSLIHECYPMSAKYFMQLRGMKINLDGRIPSGSFTFQDYVKFDQLFKALENLANELEIDIYRF
ncbi:dihydrodipicolinate synthase family protein [Reichenbachiella sp. MALMAid0571]|uniref:dihydrodipicolinate synthase family protein n=1 Tax=Reichenbachiella sp. MALMAid0571 TaxID=3143939 RepID=UPI0032E015C8